MNSIAPSETHSHARKPARMSFTLGSDAARAIEEIAEKRGISVAEAVRRAITLTRFIESLAEDEELLVRNKRSGDVERIRFLSD